MVAPVARGVPQKTQARAVGDAPPAAPAAKPPAAPLGSEFSAAKKKTVALTGTNPALKPKVATSDALALEANAKLKSGGHAPAHFAATATARKITPGSKLLQSAEAQFQGLGEKDRAALWKALPEKTRAALSESITAGLTSSTLTAAYVEQLPAKQFEALRADMRAGKISNDPLSLAAGARIAQETAWGRANPDVVAQIKKELIDGNLNFVDGRGIGRTSEDGSISIDAFLKKSPEALAAVMAHEGTHSMHAVSSAHMGPTLAEETSGNLASAAVWKEVGNPQDPNLVRTSGDTTRTRDTLNDYAAQLGKGPAGVAARAAAEYAMEASKKGEDAKVGGIINELQRSPATVKAMTVDYAIEVLRAAGRTGAADSNVKLSRLGLLFANLPADQRDALAARLSSEVMFKDPSDRFWLLAALAPNSPAVIEAFAAMFWGEK